MAARPDVVAGRFALCDPIARGGSGTVWRAWDLRQGTFCAAKVMRQRDSADALRWVREQGLRLDHPHLLTPYSWAAEDEHVVVASPLLTGGSLHTLVGDYGPLAPDVVADLLDQLLSGLAHAHAAGVVHRDVTPANVLLDATEDGPGRVLLRLGDFGIAVRAGEPRMTEAGLVLGTPGYVAPEALEGAAPAPAADLYAAGQVAVFLLTGAEPADQPDLADVPARLAAVVAALTSPDPAARPTSADDARRLLSPVPPVTTPTTAAAEPLVVLTQLPPLPPGWTPSGPAGPDGDRVEEPRPAPDRPTGRVRERAGATRRIPRPGPARQDLGGAADAAGPPGPAAEAGPDRSSGARAPDVVGRPDRTPGAGSPPGSGREGRARRTRRRWVAAAAAVVAVGAGAAGVAVLADRGGGAESPAGPGATTTAPVPVVPAAVGDPCGWQQEGDLARTGDGTAVTCVQVGDVYRWQVS